MRRPAEPVVRQLAVAEHAQYVALRRHARDWRSAPVDDDAGAWIDAGSAHVVDVEGEVVAGLRVIPLRQSVRGAARSSGGIAGVVTHPLHRRRGHARRLMGAAFAHMRDGGQSVSSLYPFRASFYAAHGYVSAAANLRVEFPTAALAHHRAADGDTLEVCLAPMADHRGLVDRFRREVAVPRHSGYVTDPDRNDLAWSGRSRDRLLAVVFDGEAVVALATYRVHDDTLEVDELHWTTLAARDRLLATLAVYVDQAPHTVLGAVPLGTDVHAWLHDPPSELTAGLTPEPPMVRVVDPVTALHGLTVPGEHDVVVELRDEGCPWNEGAYRLTAADGTLEVTRTDDRPGASIDVRGLSALAFGARSVDEVLHAGWLRAGDGEVLGILDAWFPRTTVFNPYHF